VDSVPGVRKVPVRNSDGFSTRCSEIARS